VLVTEAEAVALEAEWELFRGRGGCAPLRPLLNDEDLEAERRSLAARFAREPTQVEVANSLIAHRIFEHQRRLELGSVRDYGLAKASLLDQQDLRGEALANYLGICFLDLNGARNPPHQAAGGPVVSSFEAINGFDPDSAFLAPSVIARCIQIIALLDHDEETVRSTFTVFCERQYRTLRAPRPEHEAWAQLSDVIFAA
jgi:hypothetical protein